MKTSLNQIKSPIESELKLFDTHFKKAISSRVSLLDKISYYIVKTKGKQFRPLIALLSAKVFGPINEESYTAATMVELLHTATLVHDDVVDESDQRRGFFSINGKLMQCLGGNIGKVRADEVKVYHQAARGATR